VLQCRPLLKQLERLHMLPESLFQWNYSGPQILCIPGSRTPGVDLRSPLVLSATDSRLGHSPRLRGRELFQLLALTGLDQGLRHELSPVEFVQMPVVAQGPIQNHSSSGSHVTEGLQSGCNLGCAFSKTPQHLRRPAFPFCWFVET